MSTNNIQLTGKCANINNKPINQKQNQPFTLNKKKKNEKINNLLNSNYATPTQFITPHHGPNYFVAPNLAQNVVGQSLYPTPWPHQNMIGQNAQLAPHPQALGQEKARKMLNCPKPLPHKKSIRKLKLLKRIHKALATANRDQTEKERIAWEMTKVDQLDSEIEKYRKLDMINRSIKNIPCTDPLIIEQKRATRKRFKMKYQITKAAATADWTEQERIACEMSKIDQMYSTEEKYQHLVMLKKSIYDKILNSIALKQPIPVITIPTAQTKNEDLTQDIATPAQSLQQQHNQSHVVNPNMIPEDFTQDIATTAQSLQQQHNQSHVVNPNMIPFPKNEE